MGLRDRFVLYKSAGERYFIIMKRFLYILIISAVCFLGFRACRSNSPTKTENSAFQPKCLNQSMLFFSCTTGQCRAQARITGKCKGHKKTYTDGEVFPQLDELSKPSEQTDSPILYRTSLVTTTCVDCLTKLTVDKFCFSSECTNLNLSLTAMDFMTADAAIQNFVDSTNKKSSSNLFYLIGFLLFLTIALTWNTQPKPQI